MTKATTSLGRSKGSRPFANFRTSHAPATASRVLPAPITRLVARVPSVRRLARKAPRNIPGQSRIPPRSRAARASPVGAQTGEALL